jgi:hypothetical protein
LSQKNFESIDFDNLLTGFLGGFMRGIFSASNAYEDLIKVITGNAMPQDSTQFLGLK